MVRFKRNRRRKSFRVRRKKDVAIISKWKRASFVTTHIVPPVVIACMFAQMHLGKVDFSNFSLNETNINISSLDIKENSSNPPIRIYRTKTKLTKEEIKERNFEKTLINSFKKSVKKCIPAIFLKAEIITGCPKNVLLALSFKESSLGLDKKAKGSVLQIIDRTMLEYLYRYGDKFVEIVKDYDPVSAKKVQEVLPYIKVKGKRVDKLPKIAKSLAKDPLISGVFTLLHLEHNRKYIEKYFQKTKDKDSLKAWNKLGVGQYRLIHFLGASGARDAIINRDLLAKDIVPKESQRRILGISPNTNAKRTFERIFYNYSEAFDKLTLAIGLYRVSKEGKIARRKLLIGSLDNG